MIRYVLDASPIDFFADDVIPNIRKPVKIQQWSLFRSAALRDSKHVYPNR